MIKTRFKVTILPKTKRTRCGSIAFSVWKVNKRAARLSGLKLAEMFGRVPLSAFKVKVEIDSHV